LSPGSIPFASAPIAVTMPVRQATAAAAEACPRLGLVARRLDHDELVQRFERDVDVRGLLDHGHSLARAGVSA
jgi:hypothetical protein